MKTRKLGNIAVSEIGMGCMGFSHGYGQIPSEEYSIEAIRKAIDYGCTFFDTAEAYGPNLLPENRGHNERILENLSASEVELTDEEFTALEDALNACEVHGHRGFDEAWDAVSRYVYTALQGGSIMHKWTNDERMMITCCNDGTRPVIFKIERIDIPETPEEEEWLAKQNFKNSADDAYTG